MFDIAHCVYCKKEIEGCCYPAFEGTKKIGYRHIHCYEKEVKQPLDYVPLVTDEDGGLD